MAVPTIRKGNLKNKNGEIVYPRTSVDMVEGLTFIGTEAEYKAAYSLGQILVGTLVVIEDGDSSTENTSTSAVLGQAILGQMILG